MVNVNIVEVQNKENRMITLDKIRAEIAEKIDYNNGMISIESVLQIIDRYAEQDQEITVSVLSDENGYYPNVCGMCANAESELCEWCGGNKNFKKTQTKIPDFYKKYVEQEPMREFDEEKLLKKGQNFENNWN